MLKPYLILFLVLILTAGVHPSARAGLLKETWYMSRGKANMEIKNYKAAIEAFEKLVEINPDNQEAMRLLGTAYEEQGLTTKAVEHYDKYLERFPEDAAIAFKQAKLLEWSRFAYRRKDAIKYYRMGLAVSDRPSKRHRLAKLLAEDKKTLAEAVIEYRQLIENAPRNREIGREYRNVLLWDDRFLDEAIIEFERAVQLYPNDLAIHHQLAKLYYKAPDRTEDAIRKYKSLAAQRPQNISIQEEYAQALAKSTDHFTEAKAQFEHVLRLRPRFDTRLAYANLLAQSESTRQEALDQYKKLLKEKPGHTQIRLKYASLLSADEKDLVRAITQYQIILQRDPKNVAAHQGIAHAYAWKGDNDRAVYHANLALEYQPRNANVSQLKTKMMKGREPRLITALSLFNQIGDEAGFDMHGLSFESGFRSDITPFITGEARIGYEKYWKGENIMDGSLLAIALEYRPDPRHTLNGAFRHHAFEADKDGNEFEIQYALEKPDYTITPGFKRELRYDSLLALGKEIADPSDAQLLSAARSDRFYCRLQKDSPPWAFKGTPYAGVVQTQSAGDNVFIGMELAADYSFYQENPWQMAVLYQFQGDHYKEDASGFVDQEEAPHPGGYFSPHLFFNNTIALKLQYAFQDAAEVALCAGPSLSYVRAASRKWYGGADVTLSYLRQLQTALYIDAIGEYKQVADTFHRLTLTLQVTYHF